MRGGFFMGDKYFFCLAEGQKAHLRYICSFYVKETSYTTLRRERTTRGGRGEDNTFFPRSNFAQEI